MSPSSSFESLSVSLGRFVVLDILLDLFQTVDRLFTVQIFIKFFGFFLNAILIC